MITVKDVEHVAKLARLELTEEEKEKMSKSQIGMKKMKNPTSEHLGVYYVKSINRWRTDININGKRIHLGGFKTEQEAIDAYENKWEENYGEGGQENDSEL